MFELNVSATLVAIASGGCVPPANPTQASARLEGGAAVFENANYTITCRDDNTVTIRNKHTGETYQAWGDPHMRIDGKDTFDFWGTTTFKLEDGTKVTIETTPWKNDPSATLSSRVTITNGDFGVRVSGVDTNTLGDLKLENAEGYGEVLDAVVADGNVLHENPAGKGFVAIDGQGNVRAVDQNYINQTDLKKIGALTDRYKDAFAKLSALFAIAFRGTFLSNLPAASSDASTPPGNRTPHPAPGAGRVWMGGTPPWVFNEAQPAARPGQFFHAQASVQSLSLSVTLKRVD